jgi:DNA-binding IclR family transcriptional regulator
VPRSSAVAPKLVGALTSGLSVLRYLSRSQGPVGVSRIARELELNASTCFNLLRTLVHEGLVTFDSATKTYSIGLGVAELARGALERSSLVRLVQPHLEELAVRHSVTVVMWQRTPNERLLLVHVAENPAAVRIQMSVGARMPLLAGASGRCIAAFGAMTRAEIKARFASLRWDRAPSFAQYWDSVLRTRELGYSVDEGSYARGATIIGVPVFDARGTPTMTIGAAAFTAQMDAPRTQALVADLGELARRATRAIAGPLAAQAPSS